MSTRTKRYPISDKLATDSVGLDAFDQLAKVFEGRENERENESLVKKEKHFAVLNLLMSLKVDGRLWYLDGTQVI